jgi:formylglycine-generating enzyme required for sulfatase activity
VVIRGFWLAASETTLAQLQPFMESAENAQVNADIRAAFNEQMGQLGRYDPRHVAAHSVSWQVATQFCEWLTRQAEQQGAGRRYRLPTEDEWEYACRAGNDSAFCYGPDPRYLRCFGVYGGYEGEAVLPRIMTRMPNAFGLFDMHGNLWELTHTPYSERYDSRAGSPVPGVRVQRGGAAYSPAERCRSAQRNQIAQEQAVNTMGFRIVLEDLERP